MSTVDPIALRKLRAKKRPGPVSIVLVLAFQFVAGLSAGYGWPHMETFEAEEPPAVALAALIASIPLLVMSSIAWVGIVMKHNKLGLTTGGALAWLGGSLGVSTAAGGLGYPQVLTWIGAGCLAVSLSLAALGILAARKRRAQADQEKIVLSTGTMTTATVTDKGYVIFRESTRIFTTVTFTFRDGSGTQRWVQRPMLINAADPVVEGQETALWYDSTDPGNDKKIVVKLARDSPLRQH